MSEPGEPGPTCYRHPDRETWIRCQRCERPICPHCMEPAAVGFQCPDCVRQGHRTTRQGRGTYGGARSANPALTSMVLIGMNVVVWVAVMASGASKSRLLDWLMLTPMGKCLSDQHPGSYYSQVPSQQICEHAPSLGGDGTWLPGFVDGAYWQAITSAFTHVEVWHIGMNMLVLWFLGPQIEAVLGRARFLALYLASALGGSTFVLWFASEHGSTLGASGAIWGLLGALLILVWKQGGDLRSVLTWLGINLAMTFLFPGISWQAHLGGLFAGVLVTVAVLFAPRGPKRSAVQWTAIGAVLVLLVVAMVARAATLS